MNRYSPLKLWMIVGGLLFSFLFTQAQTSTHLSLEEAVKLSEKHNATIRSAQIDRRISKAERHRTDAIFLPQISVGYNVTVSNNPLHAFGFLLQQREVTAADFDPNKLNHPGSSQLYAASIDVQMPIFNLDQIFARKAARIQEEIVEHKESFTRDQIGFEVRKVYTQLQFAYRAQEVLQSTLQDVKAIHHSVSNFYNQGLVQKSDVLQAAVEINTIEAALKKAESNIANASDGLRLLLGEQIDETTPNYTTDPLKPVAYHPSDYTFSVNRSDIMAMEKAVQASRMMNKSAKMAFVPSINAFGSYGFNDSKMIRFKEDAYIVGISLKWNIFAGNNNRSKFKSAAFQHEKMRNDYELFVAKSRVETNKTNRDIQNLQVEIDKHRSSVEFAGESLRIMTNRHKEGLVSTTDLLMAQAKFAQQQLALEEATMNYNIICHYHQVLTQNAK